MSKITIKGFDLQNEVYLEKNKEIIEKVKSLNFLGSEYLNFDDIAINYSINGIDAIIKFCNNIYSNGIKHLIVFASSMTTNLIKSCINFILGKNNYSNHKRIKLHFVDGQKQLYVIKQKLDKYFSEDENNNIAIAFTDGFYELSPQKNSDIVNMIMAKFSERSSFFLIDKLIFFIGKRQWLNYLENHKIPNKNIHIISSSLNETFLFYTEISLILLATQGINIKKLVEGYAKNQYHIFEYDLSLNLSLKLAWFFSTSQFEEQHKNLKQLNLFVSYDKNLNFLATSIPSLLNNLLSENNVFCDSANFPSDISKIGQMLLTSKIPKAIIYLTINQNNFDFQPTTDVQYNDLLTGIDYSTIHSLKNLSYQVFNDYLISYNSFVTNLEINFAKQNEETFGEFISIIYWAKIFYGIINKLNPFYTK